MLLRTLRRDRSWTQEQLALILGVNVRTVQRLEGGGTPSLETAQALASTFGCDAQQFLVRPPEATTREECTGVPARSRSRPASDWAAVTFVPPLHLKRGMYAIAYLMVG